MDDDDLKAALWAAQAKGTVLKIRVSTENASAPPAPTLTTEQSIQSAASEPVIEEEKEVPAEPDIMQELKESINAIQKEMGVDEESDSEDDKENPEPVENDQKMEEASEEPKYRDFSFAEVFSNVEDAINKSETKVTKKDLIRAVKESVKGTKAEKLVFRVCRRMQGKCGPRQFMKEAMKAWKHQGQNKCGRKRDAQHPDSEEAQKPVHQRITCDGCQTGPVVGVRYKCVECPDFDLCELCEGNDIHSHHTFLKVKYPQHIDLAGTYRTDGSAPTMNPGAPPHHPPHHPPHGPPHGGPHTHRGPPDFFKMFDGPGRGPCGPRGGRGGRGGRGQGFGGPHMRRMMKEFMKAMAGGSDSEVSSGEEKEREERRLKNLTKRPAVLSLNTADLNGEIAPGATLIVETEVQNQTRWPCPLRSIQKLDGNMEFEQIAVDEKLKFEDKTTFSIPVTMPTQAGEYKLTLGFFGNKGTVTGEKVDLKFTVVDPEASAI